MKKNFLSSQLNQIRSHETNRWMKIRQGKVVKFSRTVKNFTKTKEENKSMHIEWVSYLHWRGRFWGESFPLPMNTQSLFEPSTSVVVLPHFSTLPSSIRSYIQLNSLPLLLYLSLRWSSFTNSNEIRNSLEIVVVALYYFTIFSFTSHILALFFTVFLIFSQNLLRDRLEMQSCLRICWKTTISVSFTSNVKYLGVSFSTQVSKTAVGRGCSALLLWF